MFKPKKKINENAVKKDFYSTINNNKKIKVIDFEATVKYNKTEYVIVDKIKDTKLPRSGDKLNILTTKNNSSIDLLPNDVTELILICSRIDNSSIEKIKYVKNKILVVSNVIRDRKPEVYAKCMSSFKEIVVAKNHAKMILFKTQHGYYVIEASANPSINARNEFYIIYNDQKLYNKIKSCLNKIR